MSLLARLVLAVVVGVIVTLICMLVGALLATVDVDMASTVGGWLESYAGVLGLLAALWHFFTGSPKFWER